MEMETVKEMTGTDDYRTRLDVLEDMLEALTDYDPDNLTDETLDDITHHVAGQWPADAYRLRLVQWLQAGSPDLDETPAVDHVDDVRQLVGDERARSLVRSVDEMLGTILYGVAHAVIDDALDGTTHADAVEAITLAIHDHRARLGVDSYAMRPPYTWTLWQTFNQTARVTVEERN